MRLPDEPQRRILLIGCVSYRSIGLQPYWNQTGRDHFWLFCHDWDELDPEDGGLPVPFQPSIPKEIPEALEANKLRHLRHAIFAAREWYDAVHELVFFLDDQCSSLRGLAFREACLHSEKSILVGRSRDVIITGTLQNNPWKGRSIEPGYTPTEFFQNLQTVLREPAAELVRG